MSQKTIDTLVDDIGRVLTDPPVITEEQTSELGTAIASVISQKLRPSHEKPTLRMSNLGSKCLRELWYKVNKPEKAIPLRPEARLKFLYGDIIETLILWLAKISGHKVEGEQDELDINGVKGHRDALVDGTLVDVKSASTYSFSKFQEGLKPDSDAFGYLDQLGAYSYAGKNSKSAFVAVDKTLGHIHVDKHDNLDKQDYAKFVEERKAVVAQPEPPPRAFFSEDDGKSGNQKLGTKCSYCEFRKECWPGLRTFLYGNGPRHLTVVKRLPDVPEVTE